MKRALLRSGRFARAIKRLLKKDPSLASRLHTTMSLLTDDAFDPRLQTHKLAGDWSGAWSCSAGYDLRIIFELTDFDGAEAILLLTIGTHDEVY